MYVSIQESIDGEVIFMFITKYVVIYPFFVSKMKKFEFSDFAFDCECTLNVNAVVVFKSPQNHRQRQNWKKLQTF